MSDDIELQWGVDHQDGTDVEVFYSKAAAETWVNQWNRHHTDKREALLVSRVIEIAQPWEAHV